MIPSPVWLAMKKGEMTCETKFDSKQRGLPADPPVEWQYVPIVLDATAGFSLTHLLKHQKNEEEYAISDPR